MAEILLVRHAEAHVNKGNIAAFGNEGSPLTKHGIGQSMRLGGILETEYGVISEEHGPVLSSTYVRPQQTAHYAGFQRIDTTPLLVEATVEREIEAGIDVIEKHRLERWAPEEVRMRARQAIDLISQGELDYQIHFSHGMYIASFLLEMETAGLPVDVPFDDNPDRGRGYVPLRAAVTKVNL